MGILFMAVGLTLFTISLQLLPMSLKRNSKARKLAIPFFLTGVIVFKVGLYAFLGCLAYSVPVDF